VNYPFDAYPEIYQKNTYKKFQTKLPYDNLTTRHYKQMYSAKAAPKCIQNGTCDATPGYFKTYADYFDHPEKLKSYQLGYSITGFPYNDYIFPKYKSEKKSSVNLSEPINKHDYPNWFDYENPRKDAFYTGTPFNYGAKLHR
tara:strand:- start:180 stop:605 length:426 start_codon:yes stop_codon:yes gene_type:complete